MTKKPDGQTYEEYIDRLSIDSDAIAIKLSDLRHNSLVSRIPGFTEKDGERLIKYAKTYKKLTECDVWIKQTKIVS